MTILLCAVAALGWALWARERATSRAARWLLARWITAAGCIAGHLPPGTPIEVPGPGHEAFARARALSSQARRGVGSVVSGMGGP